MSKVALLTKKSPLGIGIRLRVTSSWHFVVDAWRCFHSLYQRQTFLATEFLWRFKKSFLSDWQKKAELSPLSLHRLFRTEKRMRVKTFALANLSSSFGLNRFWFPLFVNSNAAHLKNIVSALKGFLIVTITFGSLNRRRQQVNKSFSFEVISIIQRNCTCHQQQESRRRFIRFKP